MELGAHAERLRFLARDRDTTFTTVFDAVFTSADVEVFKTPVRAAPSQRLRRALGQAPYTRSHPTGH